MIQQYRVILPQFKRGFHLIDEHILTEISALPQAGIMHIFIQHTSAGLSLNENADITVRKDFETVFNKLVPEGQPYYLHNSEGNDDMPAHIKSALVGSSVSIPITNGKVNLGTWQGIYLCEFRNNGGRRKLVVSVWS
jgi:secondary thiamine-phosphate synthase enzyme